MAFGLTNTPATFCTLMIQTFHDYLDKFVVSLYLDEIVVYSSRLEEHVEHLRLVLRRLQENHLYVKKKKSSFVQERIIFLGHQNRKSPQKHDIIDHHHRLSLSCII